MGRGLTRRIIVGLTRFKDLAVVGSDCPDGHCETNDIAILRAERGVDFLLSGAIGGTKDLSEHRSVCSAIPLPAGTSGRTTSNLSFVVRLPVSPSRNADSKPHCRHSWAAVWRDPQLHGARCRGQRQDPYASFRKRDPVSRLLANVRSRPVRACATGVGTDHRARPALLRGLRMSVATLLQFCPLRLQRDRTQHTCVTACHRACATGHTHFAGFEPRLPCTGDCLLVRRSGRQRIRCTSYEPRIEPQRHGSRCRTWAALCVPRRLERRGSPDR